MIRMKAGKHLLLASLAVLAGSPPLWGDEARMSWKANEGGVLDLALSFDGKLLATAGRDGKIGLWEAANGTHLRTMTSHPTKVGVRVYDGVRAVVFSPDAKALISGGGDNLYKLWDVASGTLTKILEKSSSLVRAASWSPDGRWMAFSGQQDNHEVASLFDAKLGHQVGALRGPKLFVESLAFSPDSKILVGGGWQGELFFWDVQKMQLLQRWPISPDEPVSAVAFAPDGKTLACTGGKEHEIWLIDVGQSREVGKLEGHSEVPLTLAFSPDGRRLASGTRFGEVKLWDVAARRQRAELRGHKNHVWGLAFFPDGKTLVTGSEDGTVRLWDVPSSP
jgi:WD40 repeat protein